MSAHRSRSSLAAAAAGALLLVSGCAGGPEPPPFADRPPFWVQDSLPGTLSVFLHVPEAELRLEFPADARAGEQASGTLGIRTGDGHADGPLPVGHPLHGHRLLLGSTEVDPGAARFRVSVPEAGESLRARLLDAEGRVQAQGEIPLGGEPARRIVPEDEGMLPPYVPDAGGLILRGEFDGDHRNTVVRWAGRDCEVWTESARQAVVLVPSVAAGPIDVVVRDEAWEHRETTTVLSVDSRVVSRKAEGIEIEAVVAGFQGPPAEPPPVLSFGLHGWGVGELDSEEVALDPATAREGQIVVRASFPHDVGDWSEFQYSAGLKRF